MAREEREERRRGGSEEKRPGERGEEKRESNILTEPT